MTRREWKKRYKAKLIRATGITNMLAEEFYQSGLKDHDLDTEPENAVIDDLAYWE